MTISASDGPLISIGQRPAVPGSNPPYVGDYNPDAAPSVLWGGTALLDPRFRVSTGAAVSANVLGFFISPDTRTIDQVPSAVSTTNIAAAANVVNGTPMTLAAATASGITFTATPFAYLQGPTIPAGSLAIDGIPGYVGFSQNAAVQCWDPTKMISRCVSITGSSGAAGGNFLIKGADLYGQPMTQLVTATSGATTTNSLKAFKWVFSVTPQFTDAHNYSIGTSDTYGMPLRADVFPDISVIFWNNTSPSATTGFTAADTTSPATNLTGDVRGTYAVQGAASNGTLRLVIFNGARVANMNSQPTGLFGVTNA